MEKKKGMDVILDPVAERLMAFVMEQGGPSKVAAKLEKHPQLFYNIRDGKSKPSMDTLREVKAAYSSLFDLDWVIMGTEPVSLSAEVAARPPSAPTPASGDVADWKNRYQALERRYDLLVDSYEKMLVEYRNVTDMVGRLMKKLDPSFSQSDSFFTAMMTMAPIRFEQGYMKEEMVKAEGRVIPLHDRTPVRILSSLPAEPVKLQA